MNIAGLVNETVLRNDEHALAAVSRHLHPATLWRELQQLAQGVAVYITHIKLGELDAVMGEIAALDSRHAMQAQVAGQVMAAG